MPTFIKTGYWEKLQKGYKGWLNLEEIISGMAITGSGASGQIAFYNSANTITGSNSLSWDSINNRLAIGSFPLTADFEINKQSSITSAFRNLNNGVNLTTGASVFQWDILGQRSGIASTLARMQVIYNGDGITRRGKILFGVAETSGFGGSSLVLTQSPGNAKVSIIGSGAAGGYIDTDTTITTPYALHATTIAAGSSGSGALPVFSVERDGVVQSVFFQTGNVGIGTTTDNNTDKLQVNGSASFTGAGSFGGQLSTSYGTARTVIESTSNGSNSAIFFTARSSGGTARSGGLYYVSGVDNNSSFFSITGDNTNYHLSVLFNGNVLIGSTTNIASSILTLASTTKGFLPPRMTSAEKTAIATPAAGLVVYDTTLNKLCIYTGAAWQTVTSA